MLKSIILCLFGLLFFSMMTEAQSLKGGITAGFTASQVDGDNYSGFDKFGITGGPYIYRELSYNASVKLELRYTQRGAYHKPDDQNFELYKLTLHYAELPLLFQYYVHENIIIEAGPSPEVYLFHNEENQDGEFRAEDYPQFHRFGLAGNAGASYKIADNLWIGIRYTYSFVPIREHASGYSFLLNRGQYSNSLMFSVFYDIR